MIKDKLDRELKVGQWVARATTLGRSAHMEIRKIGKIEDGKVYLESSKPTALKYPSDLIVIAEPEDNILNAFLERKFNDQR